MELDDLWWHLCLILLRRLQFWTNIAAMKYCQKDYVASPATAT